MNISDAAWGGFESVVRTQHNPDSDDCNTRGYGARLTLDGDCDIEKEQSHNKGANSQSYKEYPWGQSGNIPLNKWIGHKFIARDIGDQSSVHLELYFDTTSNGDPAMQKWEKLIDYVDYDGKEWDSQASEWCCNDHKDKSLRGINATSQRYVYIRSDAVDPQYYKWITIREIDPELDQTGMLTPLAINPFPFKIVSKFTRGKCQLVVSGLSGYSSSTITVSDLRGRVLASSLVNTVGGNSFEVNLFDKNIAYGPFIVSLDVNGDVYSKKLFLVN